MAIQWQWKDKIGEAVIRQTLGEETKESTKTLYEGNAFMIFLNEWNEDGVDKYSLYTFFADETHAKRCLGIIKHVNNTYSNIFDTGYDRLVKIRINKKKSRNWKKDCYIVCPGI